MKLALFGASGGTGRVLVQQALDQGHEVTAIVRNPDALEIKHERLHVVKGDALQPDSFAAALKGQDAVLSSLGISSFFESLKPMTFHRDTARNLVAQMQQAGVARLLCLTSTGVIKNPTAPLFYNVLVQPLLDHKYEDMREMEKIVSASGLEWIIVRPFRLTDGERTGHYRVAADGKLDDAGSISRADVADFMLKQLSSAEYVHTTPAIAY